MESLDHPPAERSSLTREDQQESLQERSASEEEESTNLEEKTSFQILRKSFHEVTDVLGKDETFQALLSHI